MSSGRCWMKERHTIVTPLQQNLSQHESRNVHAEKNLDTMAAGVPNPAKRFRFRQPELRR